VTNFYLERSYKLRSIRENTEQPVIQKRSEESINCNRKTVI